MKSIIIIIDVNILITTATCCVINEIYMRAEKEGELIATEYSMMRDIDRIQANVRGLTERIRGYTQRRDNKINNCTANNK